MSIDPASIKSLADLLELPSTQPILRLLAKAFTPLLLLTPRKVLLEIAQRKTLLRSATDIIPAAIEADTKVAKKEKLLMLGLLREQARVSGFGSTEFKETYAWYSENTGKASVYAQTLKTLQSQGEPSVEDGEPSEIADHWFDNFERFLREFRNEEWRSSLLSNCLALEANRPGSISNRSVWNIAMLDEGDFWDLQDFVRYAPSIRRGQQECGYAIVGHYVQLTRSSYTRTNGDTDTFDELFKRLEAIGMLALGNGSFDLWTGDPCVLTMGKDRFVVRVDEEIRSQIEKQFMREKKLSELNDINEGNGRFSIYGATLSPLGNNIAQLCERIHDQQALRRLETALREQIEPHGIPFEHFSDDTPP